MILQQRFAVCVMRLLHMPTVNSPALSTHSNRTPKFGVAFTILTYKVHGANNSHVKIG